MGVCSSMDPTTNPWNLILPVAIANGANAALGDGAGTIASGPFADKAAKNGGSAPPQPAAGMATPYYAARYDPNTKMPKYSRQPGDVSGYALNAHQQALVDALKRDGGPAQPATTGIPRGDPSPGMDTPPAPPPPAAAQPPAPTMSPAPQRTSQNSFLALMQSLRRR